MAVTKSNALVPVEQGTWQRIGSYLRRKSVQHNLNMGFVYSVLTLSAVVISIPLVWMVSTSLKGNEAIFAIPPVWIPETLRWENYAEVFERMPFLLYLRNTTVITVFTIIGTVGSSALVAYAFACLRWPGC